jgi:hypothetical protein
VAFPGSRHIQTSVQCASLVVEHSEHQVSFHLPDAF